MMREDRFINNLNDEEKRPENYKNSIKKATFFTLLILILFSIGFTIGGKMYERKSVAVNLASAPKINDIYQDKNYSNMKYEEEIKEDVEVSNRPPFSNIANEPKQEVSKAEGKKIAYLTFDDGPTPNITPAVLDILGGYKVKATFFVIGSMAEKHADLVKRESSEGHTIGNHTYSHVYKNIYSSTDNFLSDIRKCDNIIKSEIGTSSNLIRFPGGSFGAKNEPFRKAAVKAGYHYIDWNALNGDAEAPLVPVDKLIERLKETVGTQQNITVLMHDAPGKTTTPEALPKIIEYLISQGYEFKTLN